MPKTDISVQELVGKVQRGEMVLPEMQRRFIWPATRVRDLLDSLYRGYPSGTILAWETDEQIETRNLAVKANRTPTTSQRLLLLDGQQRITSLSAILTGQPVHVRRRRKPIEVLFNLEHPDSPFIEEVDENEDEDEDENGGNGERDVQEELRQRTFVVSSRALRGNPLWVSVSDVFNKTDRDLLKPLGINSDDSRWDRYAERLQRVRNIASYMYVMQVLEKSLSYEEVTEIFVRVNSLGIKLRSSDLAMAQITSRWRGFMQLVEDFCSSLEDDESSYLLETNLPVRMLVIFATKQSRFETVAKISRKELEKAWAQAKEGLEFAVNFVRDNAGIENPEHLSSPLLLAPIATFWGLKSDRGPGKEEQAELLYWLFLAHLSGHYGMGSSETILDQDLTALFKRGGLKELKNQLLLRVKKATITPDEVAYKGIRSPIFSTLFFILQQRGAKDWWSGLRLSDRSTGKAHKIQYHHIFPKALLRGVGGVEKREINEIANLAFIAGKTNRRISDNEPSKYLEKVLEKEGKEALEAQLIPLDRSLWETSRFRKFLEWRRATIAGVINDFMAELERKTLAPSSKKTPEKIVR